MLNARSRGRIVAREAAVMAVPGSMTDQVNEFVPLTILCQQDGQVTEVSEHEEGSYKECLRGWLFEQDISRGQVSRCLH